MDKVRSLSAVVIASAGFFCMTLSSIAQEVELLPQPTQRIQLSPGLSQQILLKHPYSRVEISNPPIVDVQPNTDREATVVAVSAGATIVKFRDEKGALVGQFIASVWPPPSRKPLSTFEDVPGRVKVYRTPDRTGFYRCYNNACELVAEQQITEPSPLSPRRPATITDETTEPDKSETSVPPSAPPSVPPKP
jgi:Flp pilus assembly secretin CpaC